MDVIVNEIAVIGRAISPLEVTDAVLATVLVLALVLSAVWPNFFALAMLLVLGPVALVLGAVHVIVFTVAVGFVVLP